MKNTSLGAEQCKQNYCLLLNRKIGCDMPESSVNASLLQQPEPRLQWALVFMHLS